jgi:hypothetical protein
MGWWNASFLGLFFFFIFIFLFVTRLGPKLKWFSSIKIEPGNKLEGGAVMEQVSKEVIYGVRCTATCVCVEEVACLAGNSFNVMEG